MTRTALILTALLGMAMASCGGSSPTSPSGTNTTTSTSGTGTTTRTSHNAGRDCSGCHNFTVGGTAYRTDGVTPYPGAVVKLLSGSATGTVVMTLTADGSGNFYTNSAVTYGSGLFTTAANTAGTTRTMTATITSGACNRCHTAGTRIVVD